MEFDNVNIPSTYDSTTVHFRLAAMNLNSSSGGPDNLDYILVEISTDGGLTYYDRLRIRGATINNSFWAYSATGVAEVSYLPQTEVVFQPTNSGLQTTNGYSTININFPASVAQLRVRITARSSSSSDHWLIDNVMVLGHNACPPTDSTVMVNICKGQSYFAGGANQTSGGTYQDTLSNISGCDSIVTTILTVDTVDRRVTLNGATLTANLALATYQWIDCDAGNSPIAGATGQSYTATANGSYAVVITAGGCTDTSDCFTINNIGIQDYQAFEDLQVYPNPANELVNINFGKTYEQVILNLFSLKGQLIKQYELKNINTSGLWVGDLPAGMYLLRILAEDKSSVVKLEVR